MPSSVFWRGAYFVFLTSLFPGPVTASYPLKVKDSAAENVPLVPRDTETLTFAQPQATIIVSIPGAGISSTAFQTSTTVRAVTLPLAILAFTLTVVTYWILIKYSAQLSNQISIPFKFLRENMNRVLQHPKTITYIKKVGESEETYVFSPSYELLAEGMYVNYMHEAITYVRAGIRFGKWAGNPYAYYEGGTNQVVQLENYQRFQVCLL
ncbi:hypothetical protein GGR55DRAFT_684566 [Xylaria sp. FL0064]|nr:hypothetical protein GGR55DRAFT_684566 [Xylaria sp. FL0064]